jgi:hypothetical protein
MSEVDPSAAIAESEAADVSAESSEESSEEVSAEASEGEESSEEVEASSEESSEELTDEQADELAEEVKEAVAEGASKEEIQELVEKFKIKVNGEEKEVELDWNDKESIIRKLQLAEAAQQAMQAKAETEKAFEREVGRLKDDPWSVLEELGYNPDELAEARIQRIIDDAQKSPEQKAREQEQAELQALRDRIKKQEEREQQLEYEKIQAKAEADLDAEIDEALSSTTELPKSQYVKRRVADALAWAMDQTDEVGNALYPDVSAKDVVPLVEKELNQELNNFFDNMPEKVLERFVGNNNIERLRKSRLAKMPNKKKIVDTGKKEEIPKKRKKINLLDFQRKGFGED